MAEEIVREKNFTQVPYLCMFFIFHERVKSEVKGHREEKKISGRRHGRKNRRVRRVSRRRNKEMKKKEEML